MVGAGRIPAGGGCHLRLREYNAYLLRTEVTGIPGGLRFVSKVLEVEARYGPKQLVVQARCGEFRRKPLPEGDETVQRAR
ncbi:MAG: hypothetical protein IPN06_14275 [Burkholderiales bacterium]|nr:hypothetical protein [Burkholderiales bacterium]